MKCFLYNSQSTRKLLLFCYHCGEIVGDIRHHCRELFLAHLHSSSRMKKTINPNTSPRNSGLFGFILLGRGTKIRTQKNGFGDRYVTITSYPYPAARAILPRKAAHVNTQFILCSSERRINRTAYAQASAGFLRGEPGAKAAARMRGPAAFAVR